MVFLLKECFTIQNYSSLLATLKNITTPLWSGMYVLYTIIPDFGSKSQAVMHGNYSGDHQPKQGCASGSGFDLKTRLKNIYHFPYVLRKGIATQLYLHILSFFQRF